MRRKIQKVQRLEDAARKDKLKLKSTKQKLAAPSSIVPIFEKCPDFRLYADDNGLVNNFI